MGKCFFGDCDILGYNGCCFSCSADKREECIEADYACEKLIEKTLNAENFKECKWYEED